MVKRVIDIVASGVGLIGLAPLWLLIGAAVVLDSGWPPFFAQERVGRNFRPFRILKFRTMHNRPGVAITSHGDPRVTRVGAVLRATKLDELPQLINVLRGDMSLVGPRPELPQYVELYRERYAQILTMRPGITDPASVAFRHEEILLGRAADPIAEYRDRILPAKLTVAERYVQTSSLAQDVRVLFDTVMTIVKRGDAPAPPIGARSVEGSATPAAVNPTDESAS
jgi:lipopolysaccharide/colanic/teichoic acid biosynthesis glycosyltransferase